LVASVFPATLTPAPPVNLVAETQLWTCNNTSAQNFWLGSFEA
jgi:hypothetical protein